MSRNGRKSFKCSQKWQIEVHPLRQAKFGVDGWRILEIGVYQSNCVGIIEYPPINHQLGSGVLGNQNKRSFQIITKRESVLINKKTLSC
jgi:hypothetical protein